MREEASLLLPSEDTLSKVGFYERCFQVLHRLLLTVCLEVFFDKRCFNYLLVDEFCSLKVYIILLRHPLQGIEAAMRADSSRVQAGASSENALQLEKIGSG